MLEKLGPYERQRIGETFISLLKREVGYIFSIPSIYDEDEKWLFEKYIDEEENLPDFYTIGEHYEF